jgi:hypothetical protein
MRLQGMRSGRDGKSLEDASWNFRDLDATVLGK